MTSRTDATRLSHHFYSKHERMQLCNQRTCSVSVSSLLAVTRWKPPAAQMTARTRSSSASSRKNLESAKIWTAEHHPIQSGSAHSPMCSLADLMRALLYEMEKRLACSKQ